MEEANPINRPRAIARSIAVFFACILALALAAPSFGAAQDVAEARIDYALVQQDIARFEQAINTVIGDFRDTLALVQKPKGYYLPGYGVSLSFLINIHRAVINTPFGQVSRNEASPASKKRRIEELKEKLIQALQESGDFRQLRTQDSITIVALFEDRSFPDEPSANKTVVLSTSKKDIDELGHRSDRLREFKQRMKIVEY